MELFQQILNSIFWLVIMPFLCGILPTQMIERKQKTVGTMFLAGWGVMAAIFQLLAVPFLLHNETLTKLVKYYSGIVYAIAVLGLIYLLVGILRWGLDEMLNLRNWFCMIKEDAPAWILFVFLLLFQEIMSVVMMTPDADDAYYVVQAVIADQMDIMYKINPYTKGSWSLDYRHILAPFSMMIAFFAREVGVHATIMAHTILPLVLIPITYLIYYKIAILLFPEEKKKQSTFMILIVAVQLFGNTSLYTNETFFLTRTWQGKSILANVAIPAVFWIMFEISRRTEKKEIARISQLAGWFVMLLVANLLGSLVSSLGLLLLAILEGVLGLLMSIRNRHWWILPVTLVAMLPNMIYMMLYYFNG